MGNQRRGPDVRNCCMEMASIDPHGHGGAMNPHFHYLLKDHVSLPRDDIEAAALLDKAFKSASRAVKTEGDDPQCLVGPDGAGVDPIYNEKGILGYLAKQAGSPEWTWSSRVKLLCPDGYV